MQLFPPDDINNRLVCNLDQIEKDVNNFQSMFREEPTQLVFYERQSEKSWAIFLVMVNERSIDGFFFGHETIPNEQASVKLLRNVLSFFIPEATFNFSHRLCLPPTMAADAIGLVYIFVISLHSRYNYLKLDNEKITELALHQMQSFINYHDAAFGRLRVHAMNTASHPYFCRVNSGDTNFNALRQLGWSAIDVVRDGNCGYYALLLGIENCESRRYHPKRFCVGAPPMSSNTPWRMEIMEFRLDLQVKLTELVEKLSSRDPETIPWLTLVGVKEEFPLEKLSDEFFTVNLTQIQYFDNTLLNDENIQYQLSPFWGALVAAHFFCADSCIYQKRIMGRVTNVVLSHGLQQPVAQMNT
jgi:hypothetical protein